jgi:AraC-like DNA-binding protein
VCNQLDRKARIHKMLSEGDPADMPKEGLSEQDRKFMDELYALMEKHIAEQTLSVPVISHELMISHSKFNYKLKELTGETPGSFFRKFKLNRAAKLLREGKYNVSEVAMMTGFGTVSYFSVAFKKQFGMSPSEYR